MLVKLIKTILLILVLNVLLSAPSNTGAQERPTHHAGCALIDKSRPVQFISYEGASRTTPEVTLRLHNNTSCGIIVETDDRIPTRFVKLPDGGVKVETVTSPQDGVRLPLHYLVQDKAGRRAPETAYGWGDSVRNYEVLAGQSIVFTVPLTRFRARLNVAVPFNYAWEGDRAVGRGVGGVVHLVYFLVDDIPEAVLRRRR